MITVLIYFFIGWLYLLLTRFDTTNVLSCGLAGFSGHGKVVPAKINMLLFLNKSRGHHSTGIYSNKMVVKSTAPADKFVIDNKDYKEAIAGSTLIIGHTRWATVGAVTAQNAHPFISGTGRGTIYGTHNGWLIDTMLEDIADEHKITLPDVDSKLIFDVLAKNKDPKVLKDLPGAMAIAYVKNLKLHLYRRTSRPLFCGFAEEGMYYSSLKFPLELIGCTGIQYLSKDKLFIINEGDVIDAIDIGKPKFIPSLSANVSQLGWRYGLPIAESGEIPFLSKSERGKPHEKKSGMFLLSERIGDGKRAEMQVIHTRGSTSPPDSEENTTTKNMYESQRNFMHTIQDKEEIVSEYASIDYEEMEDGSEFGMLLIRLINNKTQEVASNIPVFVAEYPKVATRTNDKGYAAIKIDLKVHEEGIRVMILDPFTERTFYSKIITLKRMRVMEVTLNIPFRSKEEAKKINESGLDWRNHLRKSDKSSPIHFDPTHEQRKSVSTLIDEKHDTKGSLGSNTSDTSNNKASEDCILIDNGAWKNDGFDSYDQYRHHYRSFFGEDPHRDYVFEFDRKEQLATDAFDRAVDEEKVIRQTDPVKADMIKGQLDKTTLALVCAYKDDNSHYSKEGILTPELLDNMDRQIMKIGNLNKFIHEALDIGSSDDDQRSALEECLSLITEFAFDLDRARNEITNSNFLMPF